MKEIITILLLGFLSASCNIDKKQTIETESPDEFTFAFLTDIHLQPERNATEGFRKAIDKVNELNPDFVITGGDLIMDALGVSFERADSLYTLYNDVSEEFQMPVYNTFGNHETFGVYKDSGIETTHDEYNKKMYENRIGKRYYSFDHKGWHFIVLDAVDVKPERYYYGHIDEAQIEWLKSDLQKITKETPIVISVHIPFITSMTQLTKGSLEANGEGLVITNARDVLLLMYEYNLKLVLQGHLHFLEDIYVGNKTHFITGGAVSASWWEGPRGIMEEGFVLVKVKDDQLDWDYIDYGWEIAKDLNLIKF
jgi:3',5'-cyclic AMP phosphodiesterase CpdA